MITVKMREFSFDAPALEYAQRFAQDISEHFKCKIEIVVGDPNVNAHYHETFVYEPVLAEADDPFEDESDTGVTSPATADTAKLGPKPVDAPPETKPDAAKAPVQEPAKAGTGAAASGQSAAAPGSAAESASKDPAKAEKKS